MPCYRRENIGRPMSKTCNYVRTQSAQAYRYFAMHCQSTAERERLLQCVCLSAPSPSRVPSRRLYQKEATCRTPLLVDHQPRSRVKRVIWFRGIGISSIISKVSGLLRNWWFSRLVDSLGSERNWLQWCQRSKGWWTERRRDNIVWIDVNTIAPCMLAHACRAIKRETWNDS